MFYQFGFIKETLCEFLYFLFYLLGIYINLVFEFQFVFTKLTTIKEVLHRLFDEERTKALMFLPGFCEQVEGTLTIGYFCRIY